jgi:glycosyltransferase involved in cell wall biosynthesis
MPIKSPIRILYLAPCWPGRVYGSALRATHIARSLQAIGQVDFVVVKPADDEDERSSTRNLGDCLGVKRLVKLRWVEWHPLRERLRAGLDPRFMGYEDRLAEPQDRLSVLNSLAGYQLVWIHALRTANVFDLWVWPRSVMDIDDIPSTFLQTLRENGHSVAERLRASFRVRAAKRRERLLPNRFTTLSVCSEADRQYLRIDRKVHVIPNGFEAPGNEPLRCPAYSPRIGFIGIFKYPPNAAGVRWFVERCWPRIKQHIPDARLRLVGSGSEGPLAPSGGDIDALGYVEDAAAEMATWSAMIVPLHIGAGTRVKIAEAFSRKCPVISTSLGAYGYDVADGRELLLADTAEAFASACVRVIRQPSEAAALAERAWHQFLKKWTWDAIQPRVWAAAEECLRNGS